MATSTVSPESGFTPRKEFIRQLKAAPNTFALLAISSSNFIRFYSFPPHVVATFRRLFEQQNILIAFREDVIQNLCELTLDGKPWANAKSITTEKLLIDILAIVYQCGYAFLSTIDYGREHDDRLAMAFSKPDIPLPASRSGTPLPANSSPLLDGTGSQSSHKQRSKRIPFAISFISATLMRVISPPLHLTPAILQAVRGSWPRGVVSEKKVGDNSFEFKLKGYKWFQQDTFATDSLRYILTLLLSLDVHSFTFLSSISLTGRSRVKDLWIFTGPASSSTEDLSLQDSPAPSVLNSSHGEIKRQVHPSESPPHYHTNQSPPSHHRRNATEPNVTLIQPPSYQHTRAASEDLRGLPSGSDQRRDNHIAAVPSSAFGSPSSTSSALRKPAPRAQIPVSVINEHEGFRANLPSVVSSSVENMTGVGTRRFSPHTYYTASPQGVGLGAPVSSAHLYTSTRPRSVTPPSRTRSPLLPVSTRAKTPPLLVSQSPPRSSSSYRDISPDEQYKDVTTSYPADPGQPLLASGAFRDSAFSSNSEASCEVPIKWTGLGDVGNANHNRSQIKPKSSSDTRASSASPMLPGGWQPTPIEEKFEEDGDMMGGQVSNLCSTDVVHTPIHEVNSRVASPELNEPDAGLRKSEAAVFGMVADTMAPKRRERRSSGTGGGWVLVNVEGKNSPSFAEMDSPAVDSRVNLPEPLSPSRAGASKNPNKYGNISPRQPNSGHTPVSAEAKAIAIIDAVDANTKSKTRRDISPLKGGLFGLGRKNSPKTSRQTDESETPNKSRSSIRDKLRRGTVEVPRNEAKRRSID